MQMKTSLQEKKLFKTIRASRKIAPPRCEHNKHVSYCLFSHIVAWELDCTTPRQKPCSVPTATQKGSQTKLAFRYGFQYPCWVYTVNVNYSTCWIPNQHSLAHSARTVMVNTQALLRLHRPGRRQSKLPEENFRGLNKVNNGDIIGPQKFSDIIPYHFLAYGNWMWRMASSICYSILSFRKIIQITLSYCKQTLRNADHDSSRLVKHHFSFK